MGGSTFLAASGFFLGASLAAGGAGLGAPPALHFTVAFSYASLTLAFRTSASPSISAFNGRSPTIFINVPRQVAASFRAPSTESSRRAARDSDTGLICGGGTGAVDVARHLPKNFRVPSLT